MLKVILAPFVILLCLGGTIRISLAQPKIRQIKLNPKAFAAAQECLNWCWAAGAQMLAKSQGVDLHQEWFVERVYGPHLPCLPTFGSFEPIKKALTGKFTTSKGDQISLTGAYHYGPPTNPTG